MKQVREHHRAIIRRMTELRRELDTAIRSARDLAENDPTHPRFLETLAEIERVQDKLAATRALAMTLNRMLPDVAVALVPPARETYPTPRPHRCRSWARLRHFEAVPPVRRYDTPVH